MTVTDAINQLTKIQQNQQLSDIEKWVEVYTLFQEFGQQCPEKFYVTLITYEGKITKIVTKNFKDLKLFLKNNITIQMNMDPLYEDEIQSMIDRLNELFENINDFQDLKKLQVLDEDNFLFYYNKNEYFEFNDLDNDYKIESFTIEINKI